MEEKENGDSINNLTAPPKIKTFTRRHELKRSKNTRTPFYKSSENIRFLIMIFIVGSYFLVELIYGAIIESIALVADAMHMLTDFIALCIGFYCSVKSKSTRSNIATFGLTRMEIVGGFMNACFLLAIAFNIFLEALTKIIKNEPNETLENGALDLIIVAAVGGVINILGLILFSHGHSHGHGGNFNIKAVFLHVMGDFLGSIAVLVSGLIIMLTKWPNRTISDPICSLIIALAIFCSAIPILRGTIFVLLEKVPKSVDLIDLERKLKAVPGVLEIHDLHIWQLNAAKILGSCHIVLEEKYESNFASVSGELKEIFHLHGVHSTSIQPEFHQSLLLDSRKGERCFDMVCSLDDCVEKACCLPPGVSKTAGETTASSALK